MKSQRHGTVLIVVLVLVVLISLAGFGFVSTMSTEYAASRFQQDRLQSQYVLESAELYMFMLLQEQTVNPEAAFTLADSPELFRGISLERLNSSADDGRQTGAQPDAAEEASQWLWTAVSPAASDPMDRPWNLRFGLQDESSKLPLQALLAWEQIDPEAGRNALMRLPGMTIEVADSILDWIDSDDEPRAQGAERDYYQGLSKPYEPRNAVPQSLDELLYVRGVSRQLLHGLDTDRNFVVDPFEQTALESNDLSSSAGYTLPPQGWSQLLTVDSVVREVSRTGQAKIDLNTGDLRGLHRQLTDAFGSEPADFVIWWRQFGPSTRGARSVSAAGSAVDLSLPARYPIASPVSLVGAQVEVITGNKSMTVLSPWGGTQEDLRSQLPKLLDLTTTADSEASQMRININEAARPVLLSIPGMTESMADQVLSVRSGLDAESRRSIAWPVVEGIIPLESAAGILSMSTTYGLRFRTQLIAFQRESGLFRRIELVFDTANASTRRLHWNELTSLGIGYPREFLAGMGPESSNGFPMQPLSDTVRAGVSSPQNGL